MKINHKIFGMYAVEEDGRESDSLIIITHIEGDNIFGLLLALNPTANSNNIINDWMLEYVDELDKSHVFKLNTKERPDILEEFNNAGYLGRIEKLEIKRKLSKLVESVPENERWIERE